MRGENEYYAKGLAPDMTGVDNDRNFFDFPPFHSPVHSTIEHFEDRTSYCNCLPARAFARVLRPPVGSIVHAHACCTFATGTLAVLLVRVASRLSKQ